MKDQTTCSKRWLWVPQKLKIKGWQNTYHAKSKQEKNFKKKNITRDKEGYFIMVKASVC